MSLHSPGAEGLRLALRVARRPESATLRLSTPEGDDWILAGTNLPEGDPHWLPLVRGTP